MNRITLRTVIYSLALAGLLSTSAIAAQAPATAPETKAAPAAAPATAAQITREEQLKNDWPWLGKYKENDLALAPPAAGENRVVFMGDSITHGWHLDESFPGKPYINRGISGQTSPQMVLRFRQDVRNSVE